MHVFLFRYLPIAIVCASIGFSTDGLGATSSASFRGLGFAYVQAVSADGSTVIGSYGFRWNRRTGLSLLQNVPDADSYNPISVSADGAIITGNSYMVATGARGLFRWTQKTGIKHTIHPAQAPTGLFGLGASDDCSVVLGSFKKGQLTEGFRWSAETGLQPMGYLPGGGFYSDARSITPDRKVIVGESSSANGLQSYRWTNGRGMQGLGFLPGSSYNVPVGISNDGAVVVGESWNVTPTMYRWTEATGMVALPHSSNSRYTIPYSVSADGSIVVGLSALENGRSIFPYRWDASNGTQSVVELLTMAGVDLSGWKLWKAVDVSADGSTIVGDGEHDGVPEAWIAVIPTQSSTATPTPTPFPTAPPVAPPKQNRLDRKRPHLRIMGATIRRTELPFVILSGTADDNRSVKRVEWKTDDQHYMQTGGMPHRWYQLIALRTGANTVFLRAVDASGNVSLDQRVSIWRD